MLTILALTFTSCADLFEVENPNAVLESQLDKPAMIGALSNSAQGAVSRVYTDAALVAGLVADGIIAAQTSLSGSRYIDIGVFKGNHPIMGELWNQLAAARWTTTDVTKRLVNMVDNPKSDIRIARSYFWDAIARITLADMFRAIPFDNGKPRTPIEVYKGAIQRLKKAVKIAKAAPNSLERTQYLAASYATLARTYRSLYFERGGDMSAFAEAAKYAKKALSVDPDFYLEILIASPGTQNQIYLNLNLGNYYAMDPGYADIIDPVTGEHDPRIDHGPFKGLSNLRQDSLYSQLKYTSGNANMPVSRWQEAELILAEYAWLQGKLNKAVNHINRVRSAVGLAPFSSSDPQKIKKQIMYERKCEFWLELRRWQDMRYYNIIPDRWVPRGVDLGVDRRFHVSQREEDANPYM